MKKLIVLGILLALFFGCLDFGGGSNVGGTERIIQPKKSVIVITEPPKNQTIAGNNTPIVNQTPVEKPEMNFTIDNSEPLGVYFIKLCDEIGGQDSAAVLVKKADFDMLIDAGSTSSYGRVLDFLRSRNIDDIEVLVSSAGEDGRYGGLTKIADEYSIDELWWGGSTYSQEYVHTIQELEKKAGKTLVVKRGYTREVNGITFEVLNPINKYYDDVNNDAVVLRISDRNTTLLMMSNIQGGPQGEMINDIEDKIKVDIIEAPYYGTGKGTANIGIFLQKSAPKYAVIEGCMDSTSGGSNRLPFKRLMDQYGVSYYETYKQGTVKVTIDKNGYGITTDADAVKKK
jgi:beta-lactamase superfamily II metal-dependent hydrolase